MIEAYREPERTTGREMMRKLIESIGTGVPVTLVEIITWLCTCREAAFLQQFGRHFGGRRRAVVHDDGQHRPPPGTSSAPGGTTGSPVAEGKSAGYGVG
jgi:hypothetical protein